MKDQAPTHPLVPQHYMSSSSSPIIVNSRSPTPTNNAQSKDHHVTQPNTPADEQHVVNVEPSREEIRQALEQALERIAVPDPEHSPPPAFGTPTEGTEPSPDTILRLFVLFEQPFTEMRSANDSDSQLPALLDEFRQKWSTLLLAKYTLRQHESALLASYQKLCETNIPTPQRRLIRTAFKAANTPGQDPDFSQHTQIGLRLNSTAGHQQEGRNLQETNRPHELPHVAPTQRPEGNRPLQQLDSGRGTSRNELGRPNGDLETNRLVRTKSDRESRCFICSAVGHHIDQCARYTCSFCKHVAPHHFEKYCILNDHRAKPGPSYAKTLNTRARIARQWHEREMERNVPRQPEQPRSTSKHRPGPSGPGNITLPPTTSTNNATTTATKDRSTSRGRTVLRAGLLTQDNIKGPRFNLSRHPSARTNGNPYPTLYELNQRLVRRAIAPQKPPRLPPSQRNRYADLSHQGQTNGYSEDNYEYPYDDVAIYNNTGSPTGLDI